MMVPNNSVIEKVFEMGLKPTVSDRVILLLDEIKAEVELDSGVIVLKATAQESPMRTGTVIAKGEDVVAVEQRDRVVLGKFYGWAIPYEYSDVCKMIVVSEDQIDALVVEDN